MFAFLGRHPSWILAALALFLYLFRLGAAPLWDRDEPRNAGCAREMLERKDWIVPVFNSQLRTHKPVFLYWMMMSAYTVFGDHEFSARLGSALLAVGTVLITYGIGRRLAGGRVASWSGGILATSLLFTMSARAATPDASLVFFSTLALGLWCWSRSPTSFAAAEIVSLPWWSAVGIYAAMGGAVLAKGPVGCVLPLGVLGVHGLLERAQVSRRAAPRSPWRLFLAAISPKNVLATLWSLRPLTALATILVVAAPWYVAVGWRTDGVWVREFLGQHNLSRALKPMEGHDGSWLFYPATLLVGFFPWSVLTFPWLLDLSVAITLRRDGRTSAKQPSPAESSTTSKQPAKILIAATEPITRRRDGRTPSIEPARPMSSTTSKQLTANPLGAKDLITLRQFCLVWLIVYLSAFTLAQTKLPSYLLPAYPAVALLLGDFIARWCTRQSPISDRWFTTGAVTLSVVGCLILAGAIWAQLQYFPHATILLGVGLMPILGGLACLAATYRGPRSMRFHALAATAMGLNIIVFGLVTATIGSYQDAPELLASLRRAHGDHPMASWGALEPSWVYYGGQSIEELGDSSPDRLKEFWSRYPNGTVLMPQDWQPIVQASVPEAEIVARVPYFLKDKQLHAWRVAPVRMAARSSTERAP